MPHFLLTWLLTAVSLIITSYLVPGFHVTDFKGAMIAALILGLANAIIKPILVILTLPLTIITLGLFLLVVNAITLSFVSYVTHNYGFTINGFLPAFIGSIVLSLVSWSIHKLFVRN